LCKSNKAVFIFQICIVMILFFVFLFLLELLTAITVRFYFFKPTLLKKVILWNFVPVTFFLILGGTINYVLSFDYQFERYTLFFYIISFYMVWIIPKIFLLIIFPFIFIWSRFNKHLLNSSVFKWSILSLTIFFACLLMYGIFIGRNNVKVSHIELKIDRLPRSFDGFKIVQISDIHAGSFWLNTKLFKKLIDSCNVQKPDLILFTGDAVNQFASELSIISDDLKQLKARYGKFAILGNHDFGDYTIWKSPSEKDKNLNDLIKYLTNNGFKYLRNEHNYICKGNDSIVLVGVDNWGLKPFKQYGDLSKALRGIDTNIFSIVLSHDPTHWDEQIKYSFVQSITLSGHTHAFQFGFDFYGIKWSPSSLKYKKWWGLYKEKNNYLYVSRGIGTIGYMGRIGMWPEIVLITLKCND